jgi:DNA-binding LacI/PurR family transcriptional regulator
MASWDWLSLTSLSQPVDGIADAAIAMLLRRLEKPESPYEHRPFEPRLIIRGSAPNTAQ